MKSKVWTLGLNRVEDSPNRARIAVALADRPYADPHSRLDALPIGAQVCNVFLWGISLKHRHDIDSGILSEKRVVALDCEVLMIGYGKAGARQHVLLTHEVLSDGRQQVAVALPTSYFLGV